MKRKRGKQTLTIARGIIAASCGFLASYAIAFWGIALIRGMAARVASIFWYALLVLVIGVAIFVCVMYFLGRFFGGVQQQNIFFVLRDAMKRIAAGDFDVTVPFESHDRNNFVGEVVSSLNEMAGSLKKLEAMRQEFVSDVSHEIQSPLTSIAGFAKALHDEELGRDQRDHYLNIIEEESRRLSRLSDNLLKLSALDSKTQHVVLSSYRLDAQLRSVILAAEPQWLEKRIVVGAELDPIVINADEAMLRQVWGNLVHNAIKFTPIGGRITVMGRQNGDGALVSVIDSGAGIAAADLPLVFDRFFKADKSRTAKSGGSGLGLAIAQKIVALHDGTIEAASPGIGLGATFSVRLPCHADAAREAGADG